MNSDIDCVCALCLNTQPIKLRDTDISIDGIDGHWVSLSALGLTISTLDVCI